jgi:uncharacterized protein involved in exopolysaccharide biosynthesis
MEEQNVKVIDLGDVLKYLWKSKIVILACTIIMIGVAIFGVNRKVKPSYMTSIQVRLPQYVDDRTVNTAVSYAKGNSLIQFYKSQNMDPDYPDIIVDAKPIKNSTIVRIEFRGQEPKKIKEFADAYQIIYVDGINQFINEKAINDIEISKAQSNSTEKLTQLEANLPLAKATVQKDGGIPSLDYNADVKRKNIIKFGVFGLIIGCGISMVRFGAQIVKMSRELK